MTSLRVFSLILAFSFTLTSCFQTKSFLRKPKLCKRYLEDVPTPKPQDDPYDSKIKEDWELKEERKKRRKERETKNMCRMDISQAKWRSHIANMTTGLIITAVVAAGLSVLIIVLLPDIRSGHSNSCPKCKKTIIRSDGVVQSYWVCC